MPRFAEVTHHDWIAAAPEIVKSQFADLHHHIAADVHPKLRFQVLQHSARRARYVQEVTLLGIRQRDVFEREFAADGTMTDTSVEGFNKGGSLSVRFKAEPRDGAAGTAVEVVVRLPLPPLVGPLLRPLLESQVRRELRAAVAEDKRDIELGGYRPRQAALAAAA